MPHGLPCGIFLTLIENRSTLSGIKIATHTFDTFGKRISEYNFKKLRFIHIEASRSY